ncbi:MAG: dienelactone hydrolase family protein, partial [Symploca sp. SIO2B6]|nr:dienelactone hydrolase family protein [Symploca sp. SIO2B6]
HQGDRPISSPLLVGMEDLAVTTEAVTYGGTEEQPLTGYLAQPAESSPDQPGLIVIQEWWGLNDNIKAMTRRLASEGYTALAVDLYDGEVADTPDVARALVQKALETPEQLEQNVVAAYDYLANTLNTPTVGSIGWCFGGTWSLNTALALPNDLDAAVIYYGGGMTTERDRLETLQMPIQGHFGLLDTRPSPETGAEFEAVLDDLGKTAEIYVYGGAGHAFANPSGTRYNADAAELSWDRTLTFLNDHL